MTKINYLKKLIKKKWSRSCQKLTNCLNLSKIWLKIVKKLIKVKMEKKCQINCQKVFKSCQKAVKKL
jgi:hypothetical protein